MFTIHLNKDISDGQQFSGVLEKFSFTSLFFLVETAKNNVFEDNGFSVTGFIKLRCRRLQTGLANLKKHQTFKKN